MWLTGIRFCCAFLLLVVPGLHAASIPNCPMATHEPYPLFGNVDQEPNVAAWKDLDALPDNCHVELQRSATLTVALAARFTYTGAVDELATRLGAISAMKGLPYWSVTDEDWRVLVSDAFALDSEDEHSARADFTGQEILTGQSLYFAQNDTRSWGLNIYRVRAISSATDHLVFESNNVSPIRLGPITLFQPYDLHSVLFLERLDDATWTYFSLTVVKNSFLAARENSLINRQLAFYRFLAGQPAGREPR